MCRNKIIFISVKQKKKVFSSNVPIFPFAKCWWKGWILRAQPRLVIYISASCFDVRINLLCRWYQNETPLVSLYFWIWRMPYFIPFMIALKIFKVPLDTCKTAASAFHSACYKDQPRILHRPGRQARSGFFLCLKTSCLKRLRVRQRSLTNTVGWDDLEERYQEVNADKPPCGHCSFQSPRRDLHSTPQTTLCRTRQRTAHSDVNVSSWSTNKQSKPTGVSSAILAKDRGLQFHFFRRGKQLGPASCRASQCNGGGEIPKQLDCDLLCPVDTGILSDTSKGYFSDRKWLVSGHWPISRGTEFSPWTFTPTWYCPNLEVSTGFFMNEKQKSES